MQRLKDQVALVTGASSGIGQAIAIAMGKEGANVIVNYNNNEEGAKRTVDEIVKSGSKAIAFKADVSKEPDVLAMFEGVIQEFGGLDILISNAGLQKDNSLVNMTLEEWQKVIEVNLTGPFLVSREACKIFLKQGITPKSKAAGKIIFNTSVHEVIPWAGHANYAASKGGLMMFMKSIAQEYGPKKIRINSIGPGAIQTNINKEAWSTEQKKNELLKLIPYRRVGEPQDIGNVAAWLASDEADYIHGVTIFADGGMTLYPEFAGGG